MGASPRVTRSFEGGTAEVRGAVESRGPAEDCGSTEARRTARGIIAIAAAALCVLVTGCTPPDDPAGSPERDTGADEEATMSTTGSTGTDRTAGSTGLGRSPGSEGVGKPTGPMGPTGPTGSTRSGGSAGSEVSEGSGRLPGASYTTDLDLTNIVGDWVRSSDVPVSARFEYPERLEIRPGGVYLVPQAEIYEHAPLWQGGAIEAVEGVPGRVRLQVMNDAMLEYGWSLGEDELTFTVEDDLRIEYRRLGE